METTHEVPPVSAAPVEGPLADLVARAYRDGWDPNRDLPWVGQVDLERLTIHGMTTLVSELPAFRHMTKDERLGVARAELVAQLTSLAWGEHHAAHLAASTALLMTEAMDEPWDETWFLATLMADEAKHFAVLRRFLRVIGEPLGRSPRGLVEVFVALAEERDFEMNLLVGQELLEGTAATLLAALLVGVEEPLLREVLRRIAKDEGRHLRFSRLVARPKARTRRRMEEMLFEASVAGAESLLAPRAWERAGLGRRVARRAAVEKLEDRGVIRFFADVVGVQLERRGFVSPRLRKALSTDLKARLLAS